MTSALEQLCCEINMPTELTQGILSVAWEADKNDLLRLCSFASVPKDAEQAYYELTEKTGNDPNGIKMLTTQLTAAHITRKMYAEKGINEKIFLDTMDCFPRFCEEYRLAKGVYGFDCGWWSYRQLSMVIFRLGVLEFEMYDDALGVHIPSNAVMTRTALDESYSQAVSFFARFYPSFSYTGIYCGTWLLSPVLREVLLPGSRILNFMDDYQIDAVNEEDNGGMKWVFKRDYENLHALPEDTRLQRALKTRLLAGKKIGSASGQYKPRG